MRLVDQIFMALKRSPDFQGVEISHVNQRGRRGNTPLEIAIVLADQVAVQALLQAGADPNLRAAEGSTALHFAAAFGNPDICQLLLRAGASVSMRNVEGHTAIDRASANGHAALVEMLSKHGEHEGQQACR